MFIQYTRFDRDGWMNDTIYSGARVCGLNATTNPYIYRCQGYLFVRGACRPVTSPGSKRTFARKRARVVFILVANAERVKDRKISTARHWGGTKRYERNTVYVHDVSKHLHIFIYIYIYISTAYLGFLYPSCVHYNHTIRHPFDDDNWQCCFSSSLPVPPFQVSHASS